MERETPRYKNGEFEYTPTGWIEIGGKPYPLGYRVTTLENQSLDLDHHGNILTYEQGRWVGIPKENLIADINGRGGVWTSTNLNTAQNLQRRILAKTDYAMRTRIYLAAIDNPVFADRNRVKSEKIMLLEELR